MKRNRMLQIKLYSPLWPDETIKMQLESVFVLSLNLVQTNGTILSPGHWIKISVLWKCENLWDSHSEMAERTDGASSQLRCAPNEHVNSVSFDYIQSLILSEFDRFGSVRSMACVFVFFSFRFGSVWIVPIDSSRAHNWSVIRFYCVCKNSLSLCCSFLFCFSLHFTCLFVCLFVCSMLVLLSSLHPK